MKALEAMETYLGKFNDVVLNGFKQMAMVLAAAMTVIILVQVIFRYFLNHALAWPEEMARFMMVWMAFLVAPYAYRHVLNVNMELVIEKLPPKARCVLEIVIHLLVLMMAYFLLNEGLGMMKRGMRIRASTMEFKMAYVYIILPISFGMLIIVGIERMIRDFRSLITPKPSTQSEPPE